MPALVCRDRALHLVSLGILADLELRRPAPNPGPPATHANGQQGLITDYLALTRQSMCSSVLPGLCTRSGMRVFKSREDIYKVYFFGSQIYSQTPLKEYLFVWVLKQTSMRLWLPSSQPSSNDTVKKHHYCVRCVFCVRKFVMM